MRKAIAYSVSCMTVAAGIGFLFVNHPAIAEKEQAIPVTYSDFEDLGTLTRQQRLDALSQSASIYTPEGVFQRVDNQQIMADAGNVVTRIEDINASTQQVRLGNSIFIKVQ